MYELNIHNITKIHLKGVKLFKGFSSRTLTITSVNYEGVESEHDVKLFGELHKNLMPIIEEEVAYSYQSDQENSDDIKQTAA
jgi:hypothetical protein